MHENRNKVLKLRRRLLASASLVVVTGTLFAGSGVAQPIEEVVVTGSRISRIDGSQMPTPVTVVSAQEMREGAPTIQEALTQIPQLAMSNSNDNRGREVVYGMNLRNLGIERTLVLLDGRRLTPATARGVPNITTIPSNLLQRVEVVTGGASAVYGSDAVSGVVNFILDDKYSGVKGQVQGGITERGDNENYQASLTGGTSFAGGRGHIVVNFEKYHTEGAWNSKGREWRQQGYMLLTNPNVNANNPASASNPNFIIAPNSGHIRSPGGTIMTGPLAGIRFDGGVPRPIRPGNYQTAAFMQGDDAIDSSYYYPIAGEETRRNAFSRIRYDVSENITAIGEVMIARQQNYGRTHPPSYDFTIFSGNPFIPESVQAQMNALNLSNIRVGVLGLDWVYDGLTLKPNDPYLANQRTDKGKIKPEVFGGGFSALDDYSKEESYMLGFEGDFTAGERNFNWDVYYRHGSAGHGRNVPNMPINARVYNAVDAVVVTEDNVGNSGLPLGSIVCNSSLQDPTNGCVPLNIFGGGVPPQEAMAYFMNHSAFWQSTKQDAAAANISGELFDNWAGPVSLAIGAEWRKVSTTVVSPTPLNQVLPADYVAQDTPHVRGLPASMLGQNPGVFRFGNYQPLEGSYNVKEVYAETLFPVLENLLEINAAVRYADYSLSGGVWAWKGGAIVTPTDGMRIRATRSRDVRAPNIIELFSAARMSPPVIKDEQLGGIDYEIRSFLAGNPDLDPELADTLTVGIVYQPDFVPGLTASVDFYDIKIEGAIVEVTPQQVIDQCYRRGEFCDFITRDPVSQMIISVDNPNVNLASLNQRGVDMELGYSFDVGNGSVSIRGMASYTDRIRRTTIEELGTIDRAGDILQGLPKWAGRITLGYAQGPFTVFLQERFVGSGKYDTTYNTDRYNVPGQAITWINDNTISARAYTDVTVSYELETAPLQLFLTVNNLLDQDPPLVPNNVALNMQQTVPGMYDQLGRRFTAGLRYGF